MKKPVLVFAIVVGLFIALLSVFVHQSKLEPALTKNLLSLYAKDDISLAWENVPVDDVVYRQALDRELAFLVMNVPQLLLYHKRAAHYFPYIEEKLNENNLPDDIKYLAVAESALRNDALSSAGAAGIWQFLSTTAQEYGLRVDRDIDERLSLEKATEAAISYLTRAYEKFGSWSLAMASYNRGMWWVQRALETQKVDSYYDLVLPEETMRYIFRIVAIKYTMQIFDDFYIPSLYWAAYSLPETMFSVSSTGGVTNLYDLLDEKWYSARRFFDLNPRLLGPRIPAGERSFVY